MRRVLNCKIESIKVLLMVEFKSIKEIITCSQKNPTKSECDIIRRYEGMGVIFKEKVEGGGEGEGGTLGI